MIKKLLTLILILTMPCLFIPEKAKAIVMPVTFFNTTTLPPYVYSVQHGSVTIGNGSASNTATITAVGALAFVVFNGFTCSTTSNQSAIVSPRIALSNSTTVTAARNSVDTGTVTVYFDVIDPSARLVQSVQQGVIPTTANTSGSVFITSVDLTRSAVFYLGDTSTDTSAVAARRTNVRLAAANTVTANSNSSHTGSTGYVVVQFKALPIKSVQQFNGAFTTANLVDTQTVTSVTTANTMLAYGGINNGGASYYTIGLSSSTNVNLTRLSTGVASRTPVYTVIEFQSGVLNSVQRGSIALTSVTSNTATITSVNTSKALLNFNAFNNTSTDTVDKLFSGQTLTNSTTVTANINTNSATVKTIAYEVAEFN